MATARILRRTIFAALWVLCGCHRQSAAATVPSPESARPAQEPETAPLSVERLYPYLIPRDDIAYQPQPGVILRELGHGISISLVFDVGGLVKSASAEDLHTLGLSPDQAQQRALENLDELAHRKAFGMELYPSGPAGLPFIVVGGHWASAAAILLPRLREFAAATLATSPVCASIPHRDAMLVFPCGTAESRRAMRSLVREKESDGRKPLTPDLFTFTENGVRALPNDTENENDR